MSQEEYEGIEIDRCTNCKGTWLDATEITKIVDNIEESFSRDLIHETLNGASTVITTEDRKDRIKYPKCSETMSVNNYDFSSGIIIDHCTNSHGIWLDADELEKIQIHMEHWKNVHEEKKDEWEGYLNEINEQHEKQSDELRRRDMRITKYAVDSLIRTVLRFL